MSSFIDILAKIFICVLCFAGIGGALLVGLLMWGQIVEEIREMRK